MKLLILAMLGGIIGWGFSRTTQVGLGSSATIIVNVLTGMAGALAAGWFLVTLMARSPKSDFPLTASAAALGSVALLTVLTLIREAAVPWDART